MTDLCLTPIRSYSFEFQCVANKPCSRGKQGLFERKRKLGCERKEACSDLQLHSLCFPSLPAVPSVAHMQPSCPRLSDVFEQKLVVGEVFPCELVDFLAHLLAARVYVGSLAVQMLRVGCSAGDGVHLRATVAACDAQHAEAAAQRFEHVEA